MSAIVAMLLDYVPFFVLSLIVSPIAYVVEEKYKINPKGLLVVSVISAAGYRLFSYVPQMGIIAYIAGAYASSSSVMPRSSPDVRMVYSIALATAFAVLLYLTSYLIR